MAIETRLERVGGLWVATVTLDHPRTNVIDTAHCGELAGALLRLREEDRARVVVLRGAGKHFSTGVDISEHTPELMPTLLPAFHGIFEALLGLRAVTVAAVQGYCLGGAAELALACDRVIAQREARIGFPEIRVGCYPPVAIPLLTARIGHGRATGMILEGAEASAEDLATWGAVDAVTGDPTLERGLAGELARYADKSPAVIGMAAALLHERARESWARCIPALEKAYLDELLPHPDAAEGIAAFGEKRAPRWRDAAGSTG
jgi:cyclohexa-1,5-dienecarbonyl-CoA hydratase